MGEERKNPVGQAAHAAARQAAAQAVKRAGQAAASAVGAKTVAITAAVGATLAVALIVLVSLLSAVQASSTPPCGQAAGAGAGGLTLAADGGAGAVRFARHRGGHVSFALVGPDGQLMASVDGDRPFHSASITKAMVLTARLRQLRGHRPGAAERQLMAAMIRRSDNSAANALLAKVGPAGMQALARAAGMRALRLRTDDPAYRLGNSLITARDQAVFFQRLPGLLPASSRAFALGLMRHLVEGRWGILDAGLGEQVASKAGWRPERGGGWTVVQGANLPAGSGGGFGLAVLTDADPSQRYGQQTITGVATRLLTAPAAAGPEESSVVPTSAGAGGGRVVGASEFGGPSDPGTGSSGYKSDNLLQHPDSYAELGGMTAQTATLLGGLPYMQPLRVTYKGRSAVLYKRDFGHGGGAVGGHVRAIDLWYQAADALHFNGTDLVSVVKLPRGGAGALTGTLDPAQAGAGASCPGPDAGADVPLAPGDRARILPDGRAAAPASAPPAVKAIIAAGNQINGKPYGPGCHGTRLTRICSTYDCSSSVSYMLFKAKLWGVIAGVSGDYDNWRQPGHGHWITTASNPEHIYMYVAGIRWDTHSYGAGDEGPNQGVGWHPGRRPDVGFHLRHPQGF
mgnify:CR=1 FL=1